MKRGKPIKLCFSQAKSFPTYASSTHILLSDMAVERARYNVTYPYETNKVLEFIDKYILDEM